MRFALLGNHPDGREFLDALLATGRHRLVAYTADLARVPESARRISDVEEILADPEVEAILVADSLAARPALLRRALQSERDVVCVHPAGDGPEIAYEAGMMRDDTRRLLLPLLVETLHPAIARLAEFVRRGKEASDDSPVGEFILLQVERSSVVRDESKASFAGWNVLRTLGGEITEVSALASGEEADAGQPVILSGVFERGGLFEVVCLPPSIDESYRLSIVGRRGRAELLFPVGPSGPSFLNWRDRDGEEREEYRDAQDLWPEMVKLFEEALAGRPAAITWQDAVRALELDDAARRSIAKRRTSLMEYQEASEDVGFKGTMTLVGCALLWIVLLLVIVTAWVPWLRWAVIPLLAIFLALQLLRYIVPKPPAP